MFDVTALGEILIDFTPAGLSENGSVCFEQNPGGAPANVLAAVSKLGGSAAFIGKVGRDNFGLFLQNVLKENQIDCSGLRFDDEVNTTLAFVHLDEKGERSFSFYRKPGADMTLRNEEVDFEVIRSSRVFHFGSLSMTSEPSKSATLKALEYARNSGCIISYDPNLRPALWNSMEAARHTMVSVLEHVDILKISEDELEFIVGSSSMEAAARKLYNQYDIKVLLVTRGEKGCYYRTKEITGYVPAYTDIKVIDSTGAGDAFLGGFLYKLLSGKYKPEALTKAAMDELVSFANAAGALCTAKKGAIPAMPALEQVNELMKSEK
ncbi:MAG: PfkB family carbohydrate kinase [Bacillota bacterium]